MTWTRRKFLGAAALTGAASMSRTAGLWAAPGTDTTGKLAQDPERPAFHLLPARNWMNDPNGPIYFNGKYHMFFQYNPQAAVWGDMSWDHAVSTDMLHWEHLPVALTPTLGGYDSYGCFSGSALQVGKRVYVVYTGTVKSSPELATIKQDGVQESQCLAWSDDPELIHWTKAEHPVIPLPPAGMKVTGFRDPSMWRQGDGYYMTVGSGIERTGGCVLLYRSHDLHKWEYLHPLITGQWTGKPAANPCANGEMWECPEFFALDGGHVLIYSTLGKVFWQSGRFDDESLTFHPGKTGVLDLGNAYYAPKTQLDGQGRRILWGWLQERRPEAEYREAGWAGVMSLPRVMHLDHEGNLRLTFLPEIASLRAGALSATRADGGEEFLLRDASGEVTCAASLDQPFSCTIQAREETMVTISYDPEQKKLRVNEEELPVAGQDALRLHLFADASALEMVLAGQAGFSTRFYLGTAQASGIRVRLHGLSMEASGWQVRSISSNRLTTPARG